MGTAVKLLALADCTLPVGMPPGTVLAAVAHVGRRHILKSQHVPWYEIGVCNCSVGPSVYQYPDVLYHTSCMHADRI
jgi:hypothetical protein